MNQLKSHPLEAEVDRVILDLGGDLEARKTVFDSGIMYNFIFNGVAAYISLPTYVSTNPGNLFRLEFAVGEIEATDVGRIMIAIALDMDMHHHVGIRVIPRTKDNRTYATILQAVCVVDFVREGFIFSTVIAGLELADFYRDELLSAEKSA